MASEFLRDLRDFAAELAWQAGKLALRHFQTDLTPDLKDDQTPVTVADRASERLMRELIEARYPGHSILGEEEGETIICKRERFSHALTLAYGNGNIVELKETRQDR